MKVSAVTWGRFQPSENKALPASLEPRKEHEIHGGDFLISRANTAELVARAVIVPEDAPKKLMMSDKIIRFVFAKKVNGAFIKLVNNCSFSRNYYAAVAGGTSSSMKNVSREQIRNLKIALPPVEEAQRIGDKVEELNTLCDSIKGRIEEARLTQSQIADVMTEQVTG